MADNFQTVSPCTRVNKGKSKGRSRQEPRPFDRSWRPSRTLLRACSCLGGFRSGSSATSPPPPPLNASRPASKQEQHEEYADASHEEPDCS